MFVDALPVTVSPSGAAAPTILADAPLADAIELFRAYPALRAAAVVDREGAPLGVLHETAIRAILFNPYGHSLMCNPTFGTTLDTVVAPCAVAEADWPPERQLRRHAETGGEALILTRDGRYHDLLDVTGLLALGARADAAVAAERIARAERIDRAAADYLVDAKRISERLQQAATELAVASRALAGQASATRDRAHTVAAAGDQAGAALADIVHRDGMLVAALDGIAEDMRAARAIRCQTVARLTEARAQVSALRDHAGSIDTMLALIQQVSRHTRLIALNAAIEAARAGVAGAGFGVVAGEVKALAGQTSGTARQISGHVEKIGGLLGHVVGDQDAIHDAVGAIDRLSLAIEDGVERQVAATTVLTGAIERSADASRHIGEDAALIRADAERLEAETRAFLDLSATLAGIAAAIEQRTQAFVAAVAG